MISIFNAQEEITVLKRRIHELEKAISQPQPKPKREAPPVDTLVEYAYCGEWYKSHSAGELGDDGELRCFKHGRTSKTEHGSYFKAIWRIAEDNGGWIEWNGGDCPVAYHTNVRVRLGGGQEKEDIAGHWLWKKCYSEAQIIAYKVVT